MLDEVSIQHETKSEKNAKTPSPLPKEQGDGEKKVNKTPRDSNRAGSNRAPTEERSWEYGSYEDEDDSKE